MNNYRVETNANVSVIQLHVCVRSELVRRKHNVFLTSTQASPSNKILLQILLLKDFAVQ